MNQSMKITQLYASIGQQPRHGDIDITGITADSRQVQPGYLFVAEPGVVSDGHKYIDKAVANGAAAVVCNRLPDWHADRPEVEWTIVDDSAAALGRLADAWYGNPSSRLALVGVTGTNGKTTIATLLYDMARMAGHKAGLISTVVNKIEDREIPATHTTPDTVTLHSLMADMVKAGCSFCAMEVSSHAAHQKRIAGLRFAGGIFTNLTRDHLDYHKTFANYLAAKKSFFDSLGPEAFALSNADDRNGMVMMQNTRARRRTYSLQSVADYHARVAENHINGLVLDINGRLLHTAFTGRYNAGNLLAVYGACVELGWKPDEALRCLSMLHPVAGRMQTFALPGDVTAVVDYAHTPDALANTLDAIAASLPGTSLSHGLIAVMGAGGDRDHGKRPLMGAECAKRCRLVVITSDNPRSEDPMAIIEDIRRGIPADYPGRVEVIADRAQAIAYALEQARRGEAVLIAGKGHEKYQIIGAETHHFDDCEQVLAFAHRK